MIVIAIIGVLAASLFPAYSGYQQRARDTHRITSVSTITRALQLYFNDKEEYPVSTISGCLDEPNLLKYNDGTIPRDIVPNYDNGCGFNGSFGYGRSTGIVLVPDAYLVIAKMENPSGGYTGLVLNMTGNSLSLQAFLVGRTGKKG